MNGGMGSGDDPDRLDRLSVAADVISKKWNLAIVSILLERDALGFSDLKAELGTVSAKVLSDCLDDLQESGLVNRRVISESPLRVEYSLTTEGAAMEPVVDALDTWSERHLTDEKAVVLIADDDQRIADMHTDWLRDRYDVVTEYDSEAVLERTRESERPPDVAVLDRGIAGSDDQMFERVSANVRAGVVALSSTEPGIDVVDLACEEYLTKPTDAERLADAVDTVMRRKEKPPNVRELRTLQARRRAIEQGTTERQRRDSDAYGELLARIETLQDRVDGDLAEPPRR